MESVALPLEGNDPMGAEGGATASVLGDALLASLIYWRLSRATGRVMVGHRFLVRVAAAAAVAGVVLLIPGLPDLLAAALAGVVFLGVGQLIGMHRATLYRKIAGYGLDLDSHIF